MRRFILSLMAFILVLGSYFDDADAARRRRKRARAKTKKAKVINEKKLYERIGGQKGVSSLVDEWVRLSLADTRIAPAFSKLTANPEQLAKFRRNLNDQICEMSDGPCQAKSPDFKKLTAEMSINEEQFLIFADHLFESMKKANLPEREKNELLARVGEASADSEETNGKTAANANG